LYLATIPLQPSTLYIYPHWSSHSLIRVSYQLSIACRYIITPTLICLPPPIPHITSKKLRPVLLYRISDQAYTPSSRKYLPHSFFSFVSLTTLLSTILLFHIYTPFLSTRVASGFVKLALLTMKLSCGMWALVCADWFQMMWKLYKVGYIPLLCSRDPRVKWKCICPRAMGRK